MPSYAPRNPEKLAFPGHRGGRRGPGKNFHTTRIIIDKAGNKKAVKVDVFREHLATAGIVAEKRHDGRLPRWHDLRHTCGSSLVAGWWGRGWRLDEVRDLLGHSSITVTERYAHTAPTALRAAADQTGSGSGWTPEPRSEPTPRSPHRTRR